MEGEGAVKPFLVDPVAPFHLAVVLRRPRPDQLVVDPLSLAKRVEQARPLLRVPGPGPGERPVRELGPVVRLEDLGGVAEERDRRAQRPGGLEHGVLVGEPEEPLPARLVEDGVLVIGFVAGELGRFAFRGDELDVHLPFVAREGRRLVFFAVPFRVGFVGLVLIEPLDVPESGGIGHREPGRDRLGPYVHGAPIVLPRLVVEAFDLVGGLGANRRRMRGFRLVGTVPQAILAELVEAPEPSVKRRPFDVVIGKDLPYLPMGFADPFAAMQPRLVKMGRVIPCPGLW